MDAHAGTEPEFDDLTDEFFRGDTLAPREIAAFRDEDAETATPLPEGTRRAMQASLGMLGLSLVAFASFLVYSRVVVPAPAELGGGSAELPAPIVAAHAPEPVPAALAVRAEPPAPSEAPPTPEAEPKAPAPAAIPEPEPPLQSEAQVAATVARPEHSTPAQAAPARARRHTASPEDALLRQAFRSLNRGKPTDALAAARKAVALAPTRGDAWIALGSAHDALHDRPSALRAFQSCVARASGAYVRECRALARR